MKPFYTPSADTLEVLNGRTWVCSYSGGKDSTALVTWIEWLRRSGQVDCRTPRLVQSDTGVEYPFLQDVSEVLKGILSGWGWQCQEVRPEVREKLYCQIFGRGVTPIHPAVRRMRWCTRATKIDPMRRFTETLGEDVLQLSGVRWGESAQRDGRLALSGCAAGGECGLPVPEDPRKVYAPIITWSTCQVIDWLSGGVAKEVGGLVRDLLGVTARLVEVYEVKRGLPGFGFAPPTVSALRFGCIGCPALSSDKLTTKQVRDNPKAGALRRLYGLWEECRRSTNRLRAKEGMGSNGPLKMEARKRLFLKLLQIQEDSGVTLVTAEDVAFIERCWRDNVYPRGWSAANELR